MEGAALPGVGLAAMIAIFSAQHAMAMECPIAHPSSTDAVLKETPETIGRTGEVLVRDGSQAVPAVIAGLRAHHPNATNAMIMNYLITAYCPAINKRSNLTEAQKRADVRGFNHEIGKLLFK